jgi:plasmid stabilization system protein ParE
MRYSVQITRLALAEIDQALGWLRGKSPAAAHRWYQRLLEAVDSLQHDPERCPLAPEDEWYEGGALRQLLHGKRQGVYRILFEVRGNTVFIVRVRHSAQDLLGPDDL